MMNRKGFSLLELMVVVVIIGILAAAAAPGMSGWMAKRSLDSAARNMMSHFQQARSEAIRRNTTVNIVFSTTPDSYVVNAGAVNIVPATVMPNNITLAPAFTVTSNTTGFTGRGFAINTGGNVTITNSNAPSSDNNRVLTLTLGGSVRIQ